MAIEPTDEQRPGGPDPLRMALDGVGHSSASRPPGYGGASIMDGERRHLHYYLAVLYKRRWSAIAAFVAVFTFTIVRSFTAIPVYEASVRVLVEAEKLNLVNFQDVIDQKRSLDTELAVLRSRWLADRTVKSLQRAQSTMPQQLAPTPAGPSGLWGRVKGWFGFAQPPAAPQAHAGEHAAEAYQITAFLNGLSLSLNPQGEGVLDIKYRSTDPEAAARFANAHAQEYIDQKMEARFAALKEVTDWLAERMIEQKQKVDASEQALLRFREQNQLVTAEASPVVVARLNELGSALTQAQQVRFDKEAAHQRALALRANPDELDQMPQIMNDPAVQKARLELEQLQLERARLSRTVREQHPDMVKANESIRVVQGRLEKERARIIEGMRLDVLAARRGEDLRASELANVKADASVQNRKSIELSILMREAESNRQIYDMFTQRARETGVAKEINPIRTRILDPALVPGSPVSPNASRSVFSAVLLGLALAFGVAFGFEYLDNRIKTPDDITQHLGLTFLGLVPFVRVNDGAAGPMATNGVPAEFSEEMRRVRTNVIFSVARDTSRSLVITSAGPGEGKTVISSNLAVLLAQAGQRVLLIDADMRRPSVHRHFAIPQEPGLSNVLVGTNSASEAVRQSPVPKLWLLPAGYLAPNPSELLGSERFKHFLAAVREQFDWVIIDTPPVMAVTDACVIAHRVDGTLFVTAAEMVSRHAARRAVEQLTIAEAKLIGCILNRVDVQRHGYYYAPYYQGYSSKYKKYYTAAS